MVVVYIAAGLANKMFQYAFSRGLMSHGLDVFLDQTSFQPEWSFEDIALEEVFPNIEIKNAPNNMFSLAYKKDLLSRIYRRMSAFFPNNRYLMERPFIYDELIYKKATNNCIFCGLWQTELYFNFCERDVRRNFVFTPFQDDQNIKLAEKMKNENSVAIHIRKGADYLKRNIWDGTCSVEYYNQAINYLKEHVSNPVFYLFTDNPEWVEENLKNIDYKLVDWNPVSGKQSYRDMQLMSCAKHNIIANSTYSWWRAWLNNNPQKIVVAPKIWFNPKIEKAPYIIPDRWIRL